MQMVKVQPFPAFIAICVAIGCDKRMDSTREVIWADLDGKAFEDYYCDSCKQKLAGKE